MKKLLLPALLVVMVMVILGQRNCANDREEAAKRQHDKTTDSLTMRIRSVLAADSALKDSVARNVKRTDTVRIRVKVADASVRAADSAVAAADKTTDSLRMIRARDIAITRRDSTIAKRDTVIAGQDVTIGLQAKRLFNLVDDSTSKASALDLFRTMRATDSSRIAFLEKPKGLRIPLLNLKLTCLGGAVVSVYPLQSPGVGLACGVGL
jgi:hypothetical protein